MIGNFIYFIIALLVYATYQTVETPRFEPGMAFFFFALLFVAYSTIAQRYFNKITADYLTGKAPGQLAHRFDTGLKRFTIYALIVFTIDIYGLNLPDYFRSTGVFQVLPTLEAFIFLAFFIVYMAVVWNAAYTTHRHLFPGTMSRRAYIAGNISFNLPVLLPWLALSALVDFINLLPFEGLKRLLETTYGQAIYFIGFLFLAAVLAPAIVQAFWRCEPLPDGPDRRRIEALCQRTGIKFAGILRWPLFGGRMITAGVMGLVGRFRYLLVTDALLRILSPEEIDSVIAHELGHVKKNHLLFYLIFLGGYMLLSLSILDLIIFFIIYSRPVTMFMEAIGQDRARAAALLFSVATIIMFVVYFRYIFGFFMRNFERQADTYVYSLFNSAKPLISTLKKIAFASGQPSDKPNWHHFSIRERIAYLEKCETDRRWIARQDYKIKKSMAVFVLAMALVGGIGYQVNFGKIGHRLNHDFFEKALLQEIEKNPGHPELYRTLGSLYYQWKEYPQAIEFFILALDMSPNDPETLNNLAWLYATCENESLRNPNLALDLAQHAATIDPRAHILDTLAESYHINGRMEEAIQTAHAALEISRENRSYFKDQLDRFRKAREEKE